MRKLLTIGAFFLLWTMAVSAQSGLVLNQQYVNGEGGGNQAYLIATLMPNNSAGAYDHLHLVATFNCNDFSNCNSTIDMTMGNRGGFSAVYTAKGAYPDAGAHIAAYLQDDESVSVYLMLTNFYVVASYTVLENVQETVYTSPTNIGAATPTGTLVFDTSNPAYPPANYTDFAGDFVTTGKIGVGTNSPQSTLHVASPAVALASNGGPFGNGNAVIQALGGRSTSAGASLSFATAANLDGSNVWEQARIIATGDNGNNADARGRLLLQTRFPDGGGIWQWNNNLVLNSAGYVGVGTPSSPTQPLEVNGSIKIDSGGLMFPDGSSFSSAATLTASSGAFTTLTTTGQSILGNAYRFYSGGPDGNATYTDLRTNPGTGNGVISAPSGGLYLNWDHGAGGVIFGNGATAALAYMSAGGHLALGGPISFGITSILNALDSFGGIAVGGSYANAFTAPANGAIIQGKVGIGNSSPNGTLDVVTTTDPTGNLTAFGTQHFVVGAGAASGSTSGGVFISYDQANQRGFIGSVSPGVAWRNLILQPIAGNVGIGTGFPVAPFQIGSGTAVQTVIGTQSSFAYNAFFDGSNWRYINSDSASALRMYGGNIDFNTMAAGTAGTVASTMDTTGLKMRLSSSGGLALGTSIANTDPGAGNLNVSGTITAGAGLKFPDTSTQLTAYTGTLTSLPTTVTNSSLTSVGTVTSGVWQATPIAAGYLPSDIDYIDQNQAVSGQKTFTGGVSVSTGGQGTPFTVQGAALGNTSGNTTALMTLQNNNANANYLTFSQFRNTNGSDWTTATTRIQTITDVTPQGYIDFNPPNGAYGLAMGSSGSEYFRIASGGNVGIGTTNPGARLEVNGNLKLTANSGASITFPDGTIQSTAYVGTTCPTGGDYAETVDVAGDRTSYEPGDVMVIGLASDSDVAKSNEPYSTRVAGIYSTKPGVVGRRQTTDPKTSTTEIPMAMVGIVPTKVSAENGAISRGDLLVTASIPGYAMKGTDRMKMLGAVVGKAMGSLNSGTGVVEVLVTLQ